MAWLMHDRRQFKIRALVMALWVSDKALYGFVLSCTRTYPIKVENGRVYLGLMEQVDTA